MTRRPSKTASRRVDLTAAVVLAIAGFTDGTLAEATRIEHDRWNLSPRQLHIDAVAHYTRHARHAALDEDRLFLPGDEHYLLLYTSHYEEAALALRRYARQEAPDNSERSDLP